MSYARFDQDITAKYGVVLEGWPFETFRNLADERASNDQLRRLLDSLHSGGCYFRKLTAAEVLARQSGGGGSSTSNTRTRAPRKDKGIQRGPQKATRERACVGDAPSGAFPVDFPIDPSLLNQ